MSRSKSASACLLVLAASCADGTLPPPRSMEDPSNPKAPEASLDAVSTLPQQPDAGATPAAEGPYTCPMHPDIVRDAPGTCPRCGMTLVRRARSPASAEAGGR